MIDTCGLPMKFEFCPPGRTDPILCDFTDVRDGNPLISGRLGSHHLLSAETITNRINSGAWKIVAILESEAVCQVEDLL